jgi:hypothetical protein
LRKVIESSMLLFKDLVSFKVNKMKNIFILAFTILSANAFGQVPANKINGLIIKPNNNLKYDTSLKVTYVNKESDTKKPAYFLNGKFISETLITTLNPLLIEGINIVKGDFRIDSVVYYGKIEIKTKNSYNPEVISLQQLKEKYIDLKRQPVIFMIDGVIINADYGNYFVDQNYLFRIIVDKIENTKENINFALIKLLTKSEKNLEESKKINIRGAEMSSLPQQH